MMTILTMILQVALGIFAEHPNRAGGNLCGYFPQDTTVSEAPKGYKPFYISHIARHGSRFLGQSSSDCFRVADTLAAYAEKDMLTEEGLTLLEDIRMLDTMSEGRYGDLTALGAQEHRDICARMVRHYPEVFLDKKRRKAVAWSTSSPRVIESMNAFKSELTARVPGFVFRAQVTQWNGDKRAQEVTGFTMSKAEKTAARKEERSYYKVAPPLRKGFDLKEFRARIFREPSKVPAKTLDYVAQNVFKALRTGCVTDPETMPAMGKYFTAGELYYLWLPGSLAWARYLSFPGYVNPYTRTRGGGILECIIRDADEAIALDSPVAATFRFSHDTYMMPLMAAIRMEGTVLSCEENEIPEYYQEFNYVCPACNVQLIFYRSNHGPVLVKFLRNEKETLIHGLQPLTGCYYDWNRVKKFWQQ